MTERFVIPEGPLDVPRLCRQEVARALEHVVSASDGSLEHHRNRTANYLASRFGETGERCHGCDADSPCAGPCAAPRGPTPTAPAEKCGERFNNGMPRFCTLPWPHEGPHAWTEPPSEAPANERAETCRWGRCPDYGRCGLGVRMCDEVPPESVAAARPEASKSIAAMTGPELVEHLERILSRDADERAFVRLLAKQQLHECGWTGAPEGIDPAYEMLRAAEKVVG